MLISRNGPPIQQQNIQIATTYKQETRSDRGRVTAFGINRLEIYKRKSNKFTNTKDNQPKIMRVCAHLCEREVLLWMLCV